MSLAGDELWRCQITGSLFQVPFYTVVIFVHLLGYEQKEMWLYVVYYIVCVK